MPLSSHPGAVGGSPLYGLDPEHVAALAALAVLVGVAFLVRRRGAWSLAPLDTLLVALLLGSSAIHLGLAVGHVSAQPGVRALFLVDALLLAVVARRVMAGRPAGRLGVFVLAGSIVAYWISAVGGEAPDQLGVATKLGEILALAIVFRAPEAGRVRSALGSTAVVLLVVLTAASSWVGAFRASAAEPGAVAGHHVHSGSVAPPGTILPPVPARDATKEETTAAEGLLLATRAGIAKYADLEIAAADGYHVAGMHGIDFHANNPRYEQDDKILDPARPETLVYAIAPDGRPVLLGALFVMKMGQPGPTVGGPLTVWHAHQHICFSLTPPTLTGVLSPLGTCPVGSITFPLTPEMIHIWTVQGAPQPFGDLDDAWKRAYLAANFPKR
jgi:hypothetical protein